MKTVAIRLKPIHYVGHHLCACINSSVANNYIQNGRLLDSELRGSGSVMFADMAGKLPTLSVWGLVEGCSGAKPQSPPSSIPAPDPHYPNPPPLPPAPLQQSSWPNPGHDMIDDFLNLTPWHSGHAQSPG